MKNCPNCRRQHQPDCQTRIKRHNKRRRSARPDRHFVILDEAPPLDEETRRLLDQDWNQARGRGPLRP